MFLFLAILYGLRGKEGCLPNPCHGDFLTLVVVLLLCYCYLPFESVFSSLAASNTTACLTPVGPSKTRLCLLCCYFLLVSSSNYKKSVCRCCHKKKFCPVCFCREKADRTLRNACDQSLPFSRNKVQNCNGTRLKIFSRRPRIFFAKICKNQNINCYIIQSKQTFTNPQKPLSHPKMGKKKATDKKKKGPKGKIARGKAKLERQWGEVAKEEAAPKRKGKSRILSRQKPSTGRKSNSSVVEEDNGEVLMDWNDPSFDTKPAIVKSGDDDSYSSRSDAEEEADEIDGGGAFYSKLLNNIRKTKQNNNFDSGVDSDEEDGDSAMEDEGNGNNGRMIPNDSDDESDDGEEDGKSKSTIEQDMDESAFNFFGKRFSNTNNNQNGGLAVPALPEDETEKEETIRQLHQQTEKVGVPHVDPMLELQVSKELLEDMGVANDSNNMSKQAWKQLAYQSFGCNRDVLKRRWGEMMANRNNNLSSLQSVLYPFVTRYADCLISCKTKKVRMPSKLVVLGLATVCSWKISPITDTNPVQTRVQISSIVLLHIANHVLTSRGRIQRHNRKLKAMAVAETNVEVDADDADAEPNNEEAFKDQGYTRPTVLVLLPTRSTCREFILQLIDLIDGSAPEEYLERLDREYGVEPDDDDDGGDDDDTKRHRKKVLEEKGAGWQELFGEDANNDDDFKIGLALNARSANGLSGKKGNKKDDATSSSGVGVKLYTDFYGSDIIVASPLGLKMALSASDTNDGESDFLSSIEICLVGRSDVLMMQNWDHVNEVLDSVNKLPQNNNETDFSRVRDYFLAGQAANWRQTIVCTDILDPTILSTFKRFAKSRSGILKTRQKVMEDEGSIAKILVPLRQVFQRVPTTSISTITDDRMKYMIQKILPSILQNRQKHTMIYIPSYFDFVRLRNYLIKNDAAFVSITEYSRVSETSRGRARFLQGIQPLMLYTGRAHYFLRHKIKGVRNLIFFGLPEHPEFYPGLVNNLNEGLEKVDANTDSDSSTSSIALFTKYEAHALERIVGTKQSNRMIKGDKSTFMFLS